MRVADYVANFLADITPRVYGVCGAGAMYLNDAICNHERLKFLPMHHEQAAAMAAEADARVSGKIGVVHVTAGPGGTNTITGVAGAWVDSIPMLIVAGQVGTPTLIGNSGVRQLGCNELDLTSIVDPITKYAVCVTDPAGIRYELEKALHLAETGRQGPVWVEIPLDVQSAEVDPEKLAGYNVTDFAASRTQRLSLTGEVVRISELIKASKRPLVIAGNGIRLAYAKREFMEFIHNRALPTVTSWNATDLFSHDDPLFIGRPGVMGDRPGNFAVQNADLILALGTRLSIPQIGHATQLFAPNAKLVMVDIDAAELSKPTLNVTIGVAADVRDFLRRMRLLPQYGAPDDWLSRCQDWKRKYPVMQANYRDEPQGVNAYYFMEVLSQQMSSEAVVVTDVGTPFQAAMQSLRLNGKQRLFHSAGVSAMGYGIPAAIGACMTGAKQVICLTGDGGAMLNLQELQTIAHHMMPIKIFVFANNGYATMRYTQQMHFKREAASSPESGLSCPSFAQLAGAFGIKGLFYHRQEHLENIIRDALSTRGPYIAELELPHDHMLVPRVQSKTENGKFVPVPMEDMWPYLPREEFEQNMRHAGVLH